MQSPHSPFASMALHLARSKDDFVVTPDWIAAGNGELLERGVFEPTTPARCVPCTVCDGDAVVDGRWAKCLSCGERFRVDPERRKRFRLRRDGLAKLVQDGLHLRRHGDRGSYVTYHEPKSGRTVYFAMRESDLRDERLHGGAESLVVCGSADPKGIAGCETRSIEDVFFMDGERIGVNWSVVDCRTRGRGAVNRKAKDMERRMRLPELYAALHDYAGLRQGEEGTEVSEQEVARQMCDRIKGLDPKNDSDLKKVKRWAEYLRDTIKDDIFAALWDAVLNGTVGESLDAMTEVADGIREKRLPINAGLAERFLMMSEKKYRADGSYADGAVDYRPWADDYEGESEDGE